PVYSANYHIPVPCSRSLHLSFFNPVKKSSVATAPSSVPASSSSLSSAAPFIYRPVFTYSAPLPSCQLTQSPLSVAWSRSHACCHASWTQSPLLCLMTRCSLPCQMTQCPAVKPDDLMPGDPMPAVKPDDPMPDDPVPRVMPGDPMPAVVPDDPMARCPARRSNA
ncbi:unnamed protein product, partial [Staurois parvus]